MVQSVSWKVGSEAYSAGQEIPIEMKGSLPCSQLDPYPQWDESSPHASHPIYTKPTLILSSNLSMSPE